MQANCTLRTLTRLGRATFRKLRGETFRGYSKIDRLSLKHARHCVIVQEDNLRRVAGCHKERNANFESGQKNAMKSFQLTKF